jgi:type IV pilus biogenesis protein PilP
MHVKATLLCLLVLPTLALGADSLATVGDLAKVQSDTILYDAQAARADAKARMQASLAKAGDDLQSSRGNSQPSVVAAELPTVTGISGAAGRLYASFLYPNGTTANAKSGGQIPGGFAVAEVGIDRVVLTRGDRRIPLQFGVVNAPAPLPAQPTQVPMTLPMPLPGQTSTAIPLR